MAVVFSGLLFKVFGGRLKNCFYGSNLFSAFVGRILESDKVVESQMFVGYKYPTYGFVFRRPFIFYGLKR